MEFSLNEAELLLNSVISANSENLIDLNHWSMNWAQFKNPVCHMCLAGAVVASWSLTQEMAGSNPIFVTEFSEGGIPPLPMVHWISRYRESPFPGYDTSNDSWFTGAGIWWLLKQLILASRRCVSYWNAFLFDDDFRILGSFAPIVIAILSKVPKVKSSTTDISLNFRLLVNLITYFKQISPYIKWSKSSFDL